MSTHISNRAIIKINLFVLLSCLLLFVIPTNARRFSNWKHTCKFNLAKFPFVVFYLFIAHETSPTSFGCQGISSLICLHARSDCLYHYLCFFHFLIKITQSFLKTFPISFLLHIHLKTINFSHHIFSNSQNIFFYALNFRYQFGQFFLLSLQIIFNLYTTSLARFVQNVCLIIEWNLI